MRNLAILFLTSRVLSGHIISKHGLRSQLFNSILDGFGSILGEKPLEYPSLAVQDISSDKPIVAHVIVGNTYPYTIVDWKYDITLALAHGIDGFVLNIGSDDWQSSRVADAYSAAIGTDFKLFVSFDMSVIPCGSKQDEQRIQKYIADYYNHPNQLLFNGRALVSTFSGGECRFGTDSVNNGWMETLKSQGMPSVWFVPSFFVDPATFPSLSAMDGYFNWNAGWPMDGSDITFSADQTAIDHLEGRSYMAPCSPWFFTHYGPDTYNKNFIYRGDDWLFIQRWESLIKNKASVDIVQVLTWNDFGESHYIGPIEGAQPMSESWVNGFDHQAWFELEEYYISAFKDGTYPSVTRDKIFLWARLYPVNANVPLDTVGRPTGFQFTEDYLWAVVFSTGGEVTVTLTCGSYSESTEITGSGAFKIKMSFNGAVEGGQVSAVLKRDGVPVVNFVPAGFVFDRDPKSYNFNAFVAGSD